MGEQSEPENSPTFLCMSTQVTQHTQFHNVNSCNNYNEHSTHPWLFREHVFGKYSLMLSQTSIQHT